LPSKAGFGAFRPALAKVEKMLKQRNSTPRGQKRRRLGMVLTPIWQ
jgi:hypothetical protein